ncbi:(2Fe-2S)-binding protein [Rhodococcus sp. NPDC054953]
MRATLLTDADWLDARIADTGRRWTCRDRRVNGTLWWYSASSTLLAPATTGLLRAGVAPDPALAHATATLRPDGYLDALHTEATVRGPEQLAAGLRDTLQAIIAALAQASGAGVPALWAIAADSLGNRALDAGAGLGSPAAGSALAVRLAELIGPPLPVPRFVDVGPRRFLRRTSCCLIYRAPAAVAGADPGAADRAKCVSCPHQRPEVRAARLAGL